MATLAVPIRRAAPLLALAAALILSQAACAKNAVGGPSAGGGMAGLGSVLPVMGQGGSLLVDAEDYSVEVDTAIDFMHEHVRNMQNTFDAWLEDLDNQLVLEDGIHMMNDGVNDVAPEVMEGVVHVAAVMEGVEDVAAVMEGVEDVAAVMEGVEDVAAVMEGEEVNQFDVLTAGEQVIFDIMFDIHHPKIYLDDNGFYRFRED